MAQVDYSTLPQPKLRCWIWIENLEHSWWQGVFFFKRKLFNHSYRQKDTHRRQLRPLEGLTTQQKYTLLSHVDKGQYCKRSSKWGQGLLAADASDNTCAPIGLGLFLTFLLWKRMYCSWTSLPLYFKEKKERLIFNGSNPFYIWLKMHFITGCEVRRQHGLLGPTTSHYSVLHHLLQRLLAPSFTALSVFKVNEKKWHNTWTEFFAGWLKILERIHIDFIET